MGPDSTPSLPTVVGEPPPHAEPEKPDAVLEQAAQALNCLSKGSISELRAFIRPPDAVLLVMEAVCVLFGVAPDKIGRKRQALSTAITGGYSDDYWPPSKRLLGDPKFLSRLTSFDTERVDPRAVARLRSPRYRVSPELVARVSRAAAGLWSWLQVHGTL